MHLTSETVEALVEQLSKLPTIGRKSAQRLSAYILKMPREEVVELAKALVAAKDRVKTCSVCYNVTDEDPCPICRSERRDRSVLCVVEEPSDVIAIERTGEFRGLYHVLGGVISPLDGIGPDDLHIRELVARVAKPQSAAAARAGAQDASSSDAGVEAAAEGVAEAETEVEKGTKVEEVILAMNPTWRATRRRTTSARCWSRSARASRGSRAGCRSAVTWSSPTRPRSAGPWKAVRDCKRAGDRAG